MDLHRDRAGPIRRWVPRGPAPARGCTNDAYVRLAAYADKLLRGTRTAELPIEQPTQFELVVHTKTAAAVGITLPQATLLLANRRIE
jgi:ABC-type uncharacterized transport system substrate-binding protein